MTRDNKEQSKIEIVLNNFCKCMGRCFATALKINGLFEVYDDKVTFIDMFREEKANTCKLYVDAVTYDNKIIYTPSAAKNIAIYDVENNRLEYIQIREFDSNLYYNPQSKFCASIVFDKYVYMFPETYPAIIKLDMQSLLLEYILIESREEYCFKKGLTLKERMVLLPSTKSNVYMEFDLYSNDIVIKQIANIEGSTGIWSICYDTDKECTWMVSYPKPSVLKIQNDIKIINQFPEGFNDYNFPFTMSFLMDEYYYICPMSANMFVRIHKETSESEEVSFTNFDKEAEQLMYLGESDNHLLFCAYKRGEKVMHAKKSYNVFLDKKTLELHKCVFYIDNIDKFLNAYENNCDGCVNVESPILRLDRYICLIGNREYRYLGSDIGKKIHTRMMEDK